MRKSLTIASTLALSLGAASAQTTTDTTTKTTQTTNQTTTPATTTPATTTAASQVVTFSDVPAGHWAKDAVDLITQRGLIQGFPDGTFRGNQNLTRYEAALIFYRLLQAGTLSSGSLSQTDLATITRGMQEVSTELAAISTRVTDLERLSAEQQARITALEERITALGTAGTTGTAGADTAALTARIDALEAAVRNIPAGPAGPAGAAADTTALEARIAALEQRATTTGTTTTGTATGTTTTTDTTTTGTVTTTPAPTTVVIGDTPTVTDAATRGNLYAGVSVAASSGSCFIPNAGGRPVSFCTSFGGMVGSTQLIGPFGARISAAYTPAFNALSADVAATYNLNTGTTIQPYVAAGLGLTSSTSRANGSTNTTDTFVKAAVGAEFQITNSISAFGEVDAKYYLSNKGTGVLQNNTDPAARGFVPAIKAGLKFYF